ncbi:hypothetical protein CEXT_568601 [Caerostris extrusa]|uniref:Uncharacterized protein n=1 Tax=Caerostris extrusa TaxID=172846 RepID=A0AAV4YC98_CAEEX|nr:hypothetical protein CEXT_568601 [Caerostris extrusa]
MRRTRSSLTNEKKRRFCVFKKMEELFPNIKKASAATGRRSLISQLCRRFTPFSGGLITPDDLGDGGEENGENFVLEKDWPCVV